MNWSTRLLWAPLLATAALFLTPLQARADSLRFEFTPFVGGRIGGGFDVVAVDDTSSSVDLDAGISYGLDLGLYGDSQGFYELLYSTQTTSLDSADPLLDGVDLRIDYLQFGGTALFPQEGDFFVPYLSSAAPLLPRSSLSTWTISSWPSRSWSAARRALRLRAGTGARSP